MTSSPQNHQHTRAIWTMALAAFLWSIAGVFTRHLDHAAGFEITFWRSLFAGLALIVWFIYNKGVKGTLRIVLRTGKAGLISGACWATMFICFMVALTLTSTANTLIVNALSPLFAALLAMWVLKTPITRRTWAAIAIAIAGIGIMFAQQAGGHWLGTMVAFGVPVAAAINLVTLKKMSAHIDLAPAILIGAVISIMVTLPLAVPFTASGKDVAILAILGMFQLALPCVLMIRASAFLSAPELALLQLLEVVMGPLWSWLGAGEPAAASTLVGGAIVLTALVGNAMLPKAVLKN